jgi:hypothetical protein
MMNKFSSECSVIWEVEYLNLILKSITAISYKAEFLSRCDSSHI